MRHPSFSQNNSNALFRAFSSWYDSPFVRLQRQAEANIRRMRLSDCYPLAYAAAQIRATHARILSLMLRNV